MIFFSKTRAVLQSIKLILSNIDMDTETKLALIEDEVKSITWL